MSEFDINKELKNILQSEDFNLENMENEEVAENNNIKLFDSSKNDVKSNFPTSLADIFNDDSDADDNTPDMMDFD